MPSNANSVNIKETPHRTGRENPAYHHGDLRAAAIALGMERLQKQDHADLGLRALARDLSVSATALYRHFPNKNALLRALAAEGMEMLAHQQQTAGEKAGGGADGFGATGIAYVQFAVDNPALFRLIFGSANSIDPLEGDIDKVGTAMRDLRANIAAAMPADMTDECRKIGALRAWSLVHGMAMLILDKQIEYDPELITQTILSMNAA